MSARPPKSPLFPHPTLPRSSEPAVPVAVRGFAQPVPVLRVHRRESATDTLRDPICQMDVPTEAGTLWRGGGGVCSGFCADRSGEDTAEIQSSQYFVCRLLLE